MKEFPAIVRTLLSSSDAPAGHVLATLVSVSGSSYRRPGARLLLTGEKQRVGSISGGCLEEDVLIRAERVAASGRAEVVTYDTSAENDLVWGVGLGCHGVVDILLEKLPPRPAWAEILAANLRSRTATPLAVVWQSENPARIGTHLATELPAISGDRVFLETVQPPTALTIFGAGDDAQPLLRLAKELGWHVTVADPRAAFATQERFPLADAVINGAAETLVARANPQADSLAVVMTHHYIHDVPVLRELLARPLHYIGLLGPKKRAEQICSDLGLAPGSPERARLHAPVGLDLGAETPEEVALSILAEMRAVLARRDARPLRERSRPIHA
jgi:xanthine/CO dehydrogenase XdhC/CoxF family maturation factor